MWQVGLSGIVFACLLSISPADDVSFDRQVAPLLAQRCLSCHSGTGPKGKLDLSRRDAAMRGGTSGPAIEPDKPEEGLLWENVESDLMPPKDPLDEAEKALLRRWLAEGAKWHLTAR